MWYLFVTNFFLCTKCTEGVQHTIQFSSQLLRPTGLRHKHLERAHSGSTKMGRSACSTYKQAGQPFHTSCITDLLRHQNILPPVATAAMAATKFFVSISSTYMPTRLFISVLFVLSIKRGCVFGKNERSYFISKIYIFVLNIYYQIKGASWNLRRIIIVT